MTTGYIVIAILPLLAGMGAAAAASAAGALVGKAFGIGSAGRQLSQQEKLQNLQIKGSKELQDYTQMKQQEMFEATGAKTIKAQYKEAGLNPALMYGGGGGGGTTVGAGAAPLPSTSNAPNSAEQARVGMDMTSIMANIASQALATAKTVAETKQIPVQTANIAANTENTEATKANTEARTQEQNFTNAVNNATGVTTMAMKNMSEQSLLETASRKQLDEYKAWAAGSLGNHEPNDPNSPIAKAITAGYNKVLQDLQNAKTQNDIQKATATIEQYKANLASAGIAPDSPWYVKIIGDLLEKIGLNPITAIKTLTGH
jgi:hypothetical protein